MDSDESAFDLFKQGSRLLEERNPAAAAVVLERCLTLEPGKASIQEALARAYYDQGAHAQAAETFQSIIDANPLADYAHFGLGLSRLRLGDRAAGGRSLRMAVFLKPENDDYRRALRRLDAAQA